MFAGFMRWKLNSALLVLPCFAPLGFVALRRKLAALEVLTFIWVRAQRQGHPGFPGSRFVYASPVAAPEAGRQAAVVEHFAVAITYLRLIPCAQRGPANVA